MWKTLVNGDILETTLLAEPLFLFVERALMANGKHIHDSGQDMENKWSTTSTAD